MKIIHFSGGRTSAYMTIRYYEKNDIVIFCDTKRESIGTYKFIEDFEKNEKITIVKLTYSGGWHELERKQKAIPNRFKRFCTKELKKKTARRYLRSIGLLSYTQLIGFRYDEPARVENYNNDLKKVNTIFPLYNDGIVKKDIIEFWNKKEYNLTIPEILGNCTLCFNKGINAVIKILQLYPHLANVWIEDEVKNGKHTFFKEYSITQLLEIALKKQNANVILDEIKPAFNCSCTS